MMPFPPQFVPVLLLLLLVVSPPLGPIGCRCVVAVELVLLPPSRIGLSLPNLSFSSSSDNKLFVKFAKEFRPVFIAFATLEAPLLYVDLCNNIRSIDRLTVEEFMRKKLAAQRQRRRGEHQSVELRLAIQNALIAVDQPPVERSLTFHKNTVIFEHYNERLKHRLYFFLTLFDNDHVSQDCLRLLRLAKGRPTSQSIINQLNGSETERLIGQKRRCKRVEQGITEKGIAKAEGTETAEYECGIDAVAMLFESNWSKWGETSTAAEEQQQKGKEDGEQLDHFLVDHFRVGK